MLKRKLPQFLVGLIVFPLAIWSIGCSSGSSSGSSAGNSPDGLNAYPRALGASDEASAIQALRTIATAQTQAKVIRGSYGDFMVLTSAGLLDSRFASASPNLRGYRFTMNVADSDYSVNADPQPTGNQPATGVRHFYLDSSDNVIRVNSSQPATKNDQQLGAQ